MRTEAAHRRRNEIDVERRDALIEDVEFLVAVSEWPERIAERCGYSNVDGLNAALKRYGRQDLAIRVQVLDRNSLTYWKSLIDDEDRKIAARRNGSKR